MLDSFEIISTSGVVLWSRNQAAIKPSLINGLIRDVFIEETSIPTAVSAGDTSAARNPPYKSDSYVLRWTSAKDLGLIFVAVYQSLLHLSWVDKLLDNIKILFVDLFKDRLKRPDVRISDAEFGPYFDQQLQELGGVPNRISTTQDHIAPGADLKDRVQSLGASGGGGVGSGGGGGGGELASQHLAAPYGDAQSTDASPITTPGTSRPTTPSNNQSPPSSSAGNHGAARLSRRAKKAAAVAAAAAATQSSGDDESRRKGKPTKSSGGKKMRKWDADGMADDGENVVLDYSAAAAVTTTDAHTEQQNGKVATDAAAAIGAGVVEYISPESFGTRTGKGQFVLKDLDLDDEVHSRLGEARAKTEDVAPKGMIGSGLNALSGLFRNVVGGKVLSKSDLDKPLKGMEEHLINKNVAREAAVRLCESVERELIGAKTGSFESIDASIRSAMTVSLQKILTPTTSLDLLRSINAVTSPSGPAALARSPRPYVISIVGVNGVGKSTNLSKLAYFLLQNNYNILIAACDTFRSGAVEQLRVHARNLKELSARDGRGSVELFEKGYGKDAANIARDAVAHAASLGLDVVLIDTAGRRHNDQRLMSSLEKFAAFARPDKILMVGEALVGSDSVAQARNFNAAFGAGRGLDGFIISKCDTVGDMVGSLVSMVHATGIPVVFLGVGQHYGDLRTMNVDWAVKLLMS